VRRGFLDQVKGRTFEIPGCGGFQLTSLTEDLTSYYRPGDEICLFRGRSDLVRQVLYYLEHEEERRLVAAAGYRRTLAEHTYVHRFTDVLVSLGLEVPPAASVLASGDRPGDTLEIV
jgi:spore maturation protein CgeB